MDKYTFNGTFGFALHRKACRNKMCSLINSVCERGGEGREMEGERDLDSMRARDREHKAELFKGFDPVARVPHRLLMSGSPCPGGK